MKSPLSFVLTCGFLFLGGIIITLFSCLANADPFIAAGVILALLGGIPLLVFWWNGIVDYANSLEQKENENDEHS